MPDVSTPVDVNPIDSAESTFTYVDTAIGGWSTRNNVMRLSEFDPRGRRDSGTTYMRFTSDLKRYVEEKGTVAGYPGPAWASYLPFDFDDEDDPALALKDTCELALRLEARHDVPPRALRYCFSGGKGFAVELSAELFCGFEPSENLPQTLRNIADRLAGDLGTF